MFVATRETTAGMMFVVGAVVVRKRLVGPESRIAHSLMFLATVLIAFNNSAAAKA
jgi:hypothetical protein